MAPYYASEAESLVIQGINDALRNQLKTLLETKHLYQRIAVKPESIVQDIRANVLNDHKREFDTFIAGLHHVRFLPASVPLHLAERSGSTKLMPTLVLQNVKLFCPKCGTREAFSPIWYQDATNELRKGREGPDVVLPPVFQLFTLLYQCAACRSQEGEGGLVSFLLRREGWTFILDGRSPLEQVEVPPFIPKSERRFFSDAVVAMNAGKTLAALFYLRTFIEQFARRQTGIKEKATGDKIMDAYAALLSPNLKDQMPSLREWYDKLSVPLHEGRDDAELFDKAKAAIEKHFDIRRVFKIPDNSPQTGPVTV